MHTLSLSLQHGNTFRICIVPYFSKLNNTNMENCIVDDDTPSTDWKERDGEDYCVLSVILRTLGIFCGWCTGYR